MMGGKQSNEEKKDIDSTGAINNNIFFKKEDRINIYSLEIVVLLSIICAIKIMDYYCSSISSTAVA